MGRPLSLVTHNVDVSCIVIVNTSQPGLSDPADVLASRKTAGELSGEVLIGSKPPSRSFMRRYTGYVEQFGERLLCAFALTMCKQQAASDVHHCTDTLLENLTVREMLLYTAELKLDVSVHLYQFPPACLNCLPR